MLRYFFFFCGNTTWNCRRFIILWLPSNVTSCDTIQDNLYLVLLSAFHLQEAVQVKGLRDDTTCIVIDIVPPEKPAASLPQPKKLGRGVFKSMFRRKSSESSSQIDKEYLEPDVVEELYEEGSAMLSERFVLWRLSLLANIW